MNIIRPRKELVLPFRVGMRGFYRMRVLRPDGRVRLDTGWFDNLITDYGLNAKGTKKQHDYCHVGSGNTDPAVGDTTLETWIASTNTTQATSEGAQASTPYYGWFRKTFRFAEGAAEGNIAEVGIAENGGATDSLFSRALVVDGTGTPTTITVLSDEVLDVEYEIRLYPPTSDGSFTVSGHTVTTRASEVTKAAHWGGQAILRDADWQGEGFSNDQYVADGEIGTITQEPSGSSDGRSSWSALVYSNNSLEREIEVFWGLNDGNFAGGVKSCRFATNGNLGSFQAEFDPVIDKDDTKELTIGMKVGWGRASI